MPQRHPRSLAPGPRAVGSAITVAVTATLLLFTGLLPASSAAATPDPAAVNPSAKAASAGPAAAKDDSLAPDRTAGAKVVSSPAATSALATIQTRIATYVATHGTRYTFGSYVNPTTGKIVLDTDAPASLVASLTNLSGAATAQRQAAGQVQVRRTSTTNTFSRRDDVWPFWGGGGINFFGLCSSGYPVRNSAGTWFMVTAGHCYADGDTVTTESGAFTYGTVSNRRLPNVTGGTADVELIGGQAYSAKVFTGGVDSTTGIPVVTAGGAVVGFNNYCHSGRTTGEQCGHTATSTTAQSCTITGCVSPVIAFTGGTIQQNGDSGGAFYAKDSSGAWIRGHVISRDGFGTGYAQPWTVVAATLGVSIVTG
jgi:hypothetical protein